MAYSTRKGSYSGLRYLIRVQVFEYSHCPACLRKLFLFCLGPYLSIQRKAGVRHPPALNLLMPAKMPNKAQHIGKPGRLHKCHAVCGGGKIPPRRWVLICPFIVTIGLS